MGADSRFYVTTHSVFVYLPRFLSMGQSYFLKGIYSYDAQKYARDNEMQVVTKSFKVTL